MAKCCMQCARLFCSHLVGHYFKQRAGGEEGRLVTVTVTHLRAQGRAEEIVCQGQPSILLVG